MECHSCHNAIQPGLVLDVPSGARSTPHCPCCLEPIPPCSAAVLLGTSHSVPVKRVVQRREARRRFLESLREAGAGEARCPECERPLGGAGEVMLRNCEHSLCECGCDLAQLAYEREAYQELRWLPVIHLLRDAGAEECAGCTMLMAAALACRCALAKNPNLYAEHGNLLAALAAPRAGGVDRTSQCHDCPILTQYRALAGEGLALL
jgi:hypothetical protein